MNLYHFFLLFIINIKFISCQLIFELTRNMKEPTEDNFLNYLIDNGIETEIKVGNPSQKIIFTVNFNQHAFYISPTEKGGQYNYKLSNTYSNHTGNKYFYKQQCLGEGFEGSESFIFKTIDEEDKTIKDLIFIMAENKNGEYCPKLLNAQLGLTYIKYSKYYDSNLITYLNKKEIVNSYAFHFQFANDSNEKDYLIIGGYPHEYDSENYNNKNLIKGNVEVQNFWSITMKIEIENNTSIIVNDFKFNILLKGIEGSFSYQKVIYRIFFEEYVDNNLCFKNYGKGNYEDYFYYTCDLGVDISKLPNLYFKFFSMNYTFNLTYNDLFIKLNNKYYFLIVFNKKISQDWVLGELFIKKYNIIFDENSESISLYTYFTSNKKKKDKKDENNGTKGNNSLLKTLIFIFFCSTIILSILLYNIILKFPRKKRANELDETFEYNSKDIVQKTDYSKLIN